MTTITKPSSRALVPSLVMASKCGRCVRAFCLTAAIGAIQQILCGDARQLAGAPDSRGGGRIGHRSATGLRCIGRGFAATMVATLRC